MSYNSPHIDTVLLTKFLLGETSGEEQLQVIEWLDADPANRLELDKLEEIWLESGKLDPAPLLVDVSNAWTILETRIDEHEKKSGKGIKRYLTPVIFAAASIAFAIILFNILKPKSVSQNQIVVSNYSDSVQIDTLPDGSIVTLNKNSKLTYLSSADDTQRNMVLEGEAFFEVVRDTLRPFVIKAGMGGVRVLGTSFNVKVTNTTNVTVDVVTGLVELFYPMNSSPDTLWLQLKAGERGILSHQQKKLFSDRASLSSLFWNDNTFVFKNRPLKDVFEVLSECYKVNIVCDDNYINYTNLSTTFKNKNVDEVLDVIAATFDISYSREGNTYRIYSP
jgi:ferric-dicitrate binding protein FerR (iron transport regulator)